MKHLFLSITLLCAVALSATATEGLFTVSGPYPGFEEQLPGVVVQFAESDLPNCTWDQLPSVPGRVLEQKEWEYLFTHHAYRFLKSEDGFLQPGLLVLPDQYAKSTQITTDNYNTFEGALFLPAGTDGYCRYWTATEEQYTSKANAIEFNGTASSTAAPVEKTTPLAVRTVTNTEKTPNAVRFTFNPATSGMPIETEHFLDGYSVTESSGNYYDVTVNNQPVQYKRSDVTLISYYYESTTPSLTLTARPDPENPRLYYTSFYSGLEAYELPTGVVAYTASLGTDGKAHITSLTDNFIPQGCAVLLCATSASITLTRTDPSTPSQPTGQNNFCGVDVPTPTSTALGTYYVLSAVDGKMAFYKLSSQTTTIPAQKAYLWVSENSQNAPTRIVWQREVPTDIELTTAPSDADKYIQGGRLYIRREGQIYDACGVRIK